jgi:hypothetical protein
VQPPTIVGRCSLGRGVLGQHPAQLIHGPGPDLSDES